MQQISGYRFQFEFTDREAPSLGPFILLVIDPKPSADLKRIKIRANVFCKRDMERFMNIIDQWPGRDSQI